MKKFFALIISLAIILTASNSFASENLIEASGSYVMDSRLDETPASATARAREEAKRAAVDKAGVYLKRYSKMIDLELVEDEVETVAAALLKIQNESSEVEIVEKNLLKFTVTIKALVNELSDEDLKSLIQDKQSLDDAARKYKELQEKYDALKNQMETLKRDYNKADDAQKEKIKHEAARNAKNFSAVEAMERGNKFSFAKNFEQALAAYDEAIELNPQLAEAFNNRGAVKYELGQYSAAIEDYTAAIKLKSDYADALNNRGNAYAATKNFQNAAQDLKAALKLKNNSAVIHNNLGGVYYLMKNFDAAIAEYTQAIQLNPKYYEAFYNRAVAYYVQGNLVRSLLDVKEARALNPDDVDTIKFYEKISSEAD